MPNPWDIGTARYLQHLGFKALATTSSGFAFSRGLPDADWAVNRNQMLAHITELVRSTELPVNADFESGYAHEPDELAENVRLCLETGVAGLSIEDATGNPSTPLYERSLAVNRIRAAHQAIAESGTGVLLTGRAECYLVGHSKPFEEVVTRLEAYADAGADVLYAPGLQDPNDIEALVRAVSPKPVNVLMSSNTGLQVSDLAQLGVRRISVGSSLARAAWTGFIRAAKEIAENGSFGGFDGATPYAELNGFFRQDSSKRSEE
ncbi:MAG: isocitrate lyase/phosphoenolpyruvate mutase family protein [Acidobacteriota bacterium]|nr:isocitrate lyase/phosphoenolpyruvate mutase family protein [Acidobacteriota bacterium]